MNSIDSDGNAIIERCFGDLSSRLFKLEMSDLSGPINGQEIISQIESSIFHFRPEESIKIVDSKLKTIETLISSPPPVKKEIPEDLNNVLFGNAPSVKILPTTLQDQEAWRNELIFYRDKLENIRHKLSENPANDIYKLQTGFTVEALSAFLKGGRAAGVFLSEKTYEEFYRKAQANFLTRATTEQISKNSLRKYSINPTDKGKLEAIESLQKIIEEIKKLPPEK